MDKIQNKNKYELEYGMCYYCNEFYYMSDITIIGGRNTCPRCLATLGTSNS